MNDPERPSLHDSRLDDPSPEVHNTVADGPHYAISTEPAAATASRQALARQTQDVAPPVPSGLERAAAAVRMVLPVVQKVLPLLDGSIASAVSNILLPRVQTPSPASLSLLESTLARIHVEQRELRAQVAELSTSLKQVADQLELLKGTINRAAIERQELTESLASIHKMLKTFAFAGLGLLALSILVTVILFMRIQHVLP